MNVINPIGTALVFSLGYLILALVFLTGCALIFYHQPSRPSSSRTPGSASVGYQC